MAAELAQYKYPKRKAIDHTLETVGTLSEAMARAASGQGIEVKYRRPFACLEDISPPARACRGNR